MRKDAWYRCSYAPKKYLHGSQAGFTLPELIITLSLTTVASTVGLNSFEQFIVETRADTGIFSLRTALALARSEAITRDASVVLCRRSDSLQHCAGSSASGRPDWSAGWLLFIDIDQDKVLDSSKGDQILRVFPPLNQSLVLRWNRGDYIAYQGSGRLHSLNGTFCLGGSNGKEGFDRELKIPYTGRVRITSGECTYVL